MGNIKDAQDTLSLMQDALRCYSNQKQNDATLNMYHVQVGQFIEHIEEPCKGAVGIILYAISGNLYVKYLNYHHTGYAISSKFKVVDWDYVRTTVDLTKNVKYSIE